MKKVAMNLKEQGGLYRVWREERGGVGYDLYSKERGKGKHNRFVFLEVCFKINSESMFMLADQRTHVK